MALTDAHAVEQNELVTELGIKKGTISKAAKQLAVDGYIRREARRKDKRVHILRPTYKAFYVRQQIDALHHMIEKILLDDYLPGASELLKYYLKTMMENIPRLIELEFNPAPPYSMDDIPDNPSKIAPEQWEAMRKVNIRTADKSQLIDIRTIKINEKLSPIDRRLSYLKQVRILIVLELVIWQ